MIRFNRCIPLNRYFDDIVQNPEKLSQEIGAFLQGSAVPLLNFVTLFGGIRSDWTIGNLSPRDRFALIYKRRFSVGIHLTPLMGFVVTISQLVPSYCLLSPIMAIGERRGREPMIRVRMSRLPQLKAVMGDVCDRLTLIDQAGFKVSGIPKDKSLMQYKQVINGISILLFLVETKVEIHCEATIDINSEIRKLVGESLAELKCLEAVLTILRVLLLVGPALLKKELQFLNNLNLETVCTAMNSAKIEDNGNAAVCFQYKGALLYLELPVPLGTASIVKIRHGEQTDRARGVDGVVQVLSDY
jgi:hypothetical protein